LIASVASEQLRGFGGTAAVDFDQGVHKFPTGICPITKSLPAPTVCCSGWFGLRQYQNRHHGIMAAAGSRASELPGLLPADDPCSRSRRAMPFDIGGGSE
jgi:hypothetical protein